MSATTKAYFLHPILDYLLIGGALSWVLLASGLFGSIGHFSGQLSDLLPVVLLASLFNHAHFAASTVKLYAQSNNYSERVFLTRGLPYVTLFLAAFCIWQSDATSKYVIGIYLTWSPYHYAAQAFGIALIYLRRSKVSFTTTERRILYWSCLFPFFHVFLKPSNHPVGINLLVSAFPSLQFHGLLEIVTTLAEVFRVLTLATPFLIGGFFCFRRKNRFPPMIPVLLLTNGIWWAIYQFVGAFFWATVCHAIQYLAIVLIFREKEIVNVSKRPVLSLSGFYLVCLVLGYSIFHILPHSFLPIGSSLDQCIIIIVSFINIHHFVVDGFIWKGKRKLSRLPSS